MSYTTLVAANVLVDHLGDPQWAIIDCRFSLDDTERGRQAYLLGHIPGSQYAHLDEDLCGVVIPGSTGRHPLPEIEVFSRRLSRWGIAAGVQVVVYDDSGGSIAARLWWMLRWLGHSAVSVLDGGWQSWQAAGYPTEQEMIPRARRSFSPRVHPELHATTDLVSTSLANPDWRLVDSRTPERYRGELEPIDPVAGRIPGAVNAPHMQTIGRGGKFLPADTLRTHFKHILGETDPRKVIVYCGSGVTAAHNLVALAHAGVDDARLYAGSWSEWITDPNRPVERE